MIKRSIFLLLPILLITLALTGCRSHTKNSDTPPDLLITVAQSGIYTLTDRDLKAHGWHLSELDESKIRLFRGEQEIPLAVLGKDKRALQFYGYVKPTRFDDKVAYVLHYGEKKGVTLQSRPVSQPQITPAQSFSYTVTAETNSTYQAQVREGDPWLGPRLFAPAEVSVTIATPDLTSGDASLSLILWAATQSQEEIDHHLIISLNGQELGDERWDGKGLHRISLKIPQGMLKEHNNLLLTAPGDTDAPADLVYLDKARISYRRKLLLNTNQLTFTTQQQAISIENPRGKPVQIWDVTTPATPIQLTGVTSRQKKVLFQEKDAALRNYVTFTDEQNQPASIQLAPPPLTAPAAGADYIFIVHPSLVEATQPLVDYRRSQGLRVMVATTEQIYIKFGAGMQSPAAITDFLRWAVATWPAPAPRFVLLAGDASYDPLDYLHAPYKNLIPSTFVATVEMGETISDNAMADLDGDGLTDLAVGRFPAQTPADMRAMVQKTIAFEKSRPAGDWIERMLFVADDDSTNFNNFNEDHIAMLPPNIMAENLVIAPDRDVRQELLTKLNEGRGLVSYMGHGAIDIWAQEEIFKNEDVPALRQDGRLGIFLVWACLNGYFQHPSKRSLGETLLITPDKGAVAGLFPTGQTFPDDQWVMADALFGEMLFSQPTIGEAFMGAARTLSPEYDRQRDIINTFLLLGDPALQLPW